MKIVLLYISILLSIRCNSPADQGKETPHVRQLNNDRLHSFLNEMVKQLQQYQYTSDPDIDYASILRIHHEAAVQMAKRELDWGKDDQLLALAKRIVTEENQEINLLDGYIHSGKIDNSNRRFVDEAQKAVIHQHDPAESGPIDSLFARLIISQHEGAISASNIYLRYSNDIQLKNLALKIISIHRQEISLLSKWSR